MDERTLENSEATVELYRQEALSRIPRPGGVSYEECEDCDEPIPEARRQAYLGCTRCVDCQGIFEFRNNH